MGRIVKSLILGFILVCGLSLQGFAQTTDDEDALRGPDRACLRCHNGGANEARMLGQHKKAVSPNSDNKVTCVSCHGNTSPNHRDGVQDVMKFKADSPFALDQRNGVCLSCHEIPDLRKKMWAHDIHATRTVCTNCHTLHAEKDPMKGISEKSRIKLCVDCHSKQHEEKKKSAQGAK